MVTRCHPALDVARCHSRLDLDQLEVYVANSRATNKKSQKKKSIIDMPLKERKWNQMTCPIKIIKGRKTVKGKIRTKNKGEK